MGLECSLIEPLAKPLLGRFARTAILVPLTYFFRAPSRSQVMTSARPVWGSTVRLGLHTAQLQLTVCKALPQEGDRGDLPVTWTRKG